MEDLIRLTRMRQPSEQALQPVRAALEVVGRALRVADVEAEAAEDELRDATLARNDLTIRMSLVERTLAAQAADVRASWSEVLRRMSDAELSVGEAAATAEALHALTEGRDLDEALPFAGDQSFEEFLADPDRGITFTGVAPRPAWTSPPSSDLAVLGEVVPAPVAPAHAERLVAMTAAPLALAIDPFAGLHVSVDGSAGRRYGVLLGDGTVSRLSDRTDVSSSGVERVSVDDFLADDDAGSLLQHFPDRHGYAPVPVFAPNLVALRALAVVQAEGDAIDDGELLGTWAQCGAMLLGQQDQAWREALLAVADAVHPVLPAVMRTYLDSWTIAVSEAPLGLRPPSSEPDPAAETVLFDVGRVLWAHDLGSMVWYIPQWGSADPQRRWEAPFGPRDRPWSLEPNNEDARWHTAPPTTRLAKGWHAALLADASDTVFAVEQSGRWWRTPLSLAAVMAERARAVQRVNQSLAERPNDDSPPS